MSPLIVGVDVDGVVADLHEEWLRRYNITYNDKLRPDDIRSWNINEFVRPECGNKIFDLLNDPTMYDLVKPVTGARTGIAMLRERGYRVVFITACFDGTVDMKVRWLVRNGFLEQSYTHADMIACTDKHLIRAHWLIDDRSDNLRQFPGKKLLFTQPWNRLDTEFDRLDRWNQVLNHVR